MPTVSTVAARPHAPPPPPPSALTCCGGVEVLGQTVFKHSPLIIQLRDTDSNSPWSELARWLTTSWKVRRENYFSNTALWSFSLKIRTATIPDMWEGNCFSDTAFWLFSLEIWTATVPDLQEVKSFSNTALWLFSLDTGTARVPDRSLLSADNLLEGVRSELFFTHSHSIVSRHGSWQQESLG